ncbi:hypothetical protein [Nocardia flavorosea]|uniref:Uncharacterized protein n=1 Tax=Nocardia flavorosea TaxID=53429 RepID=A0A846YSZ6_9NOCA|nr:hypothetical protein [Nocardia flavorosea]NKY60402.1 hypothetical protein [Nocardia flavorosea]
MNQNEASCDATTRIGGFGGVCIDGTIKCERSGEHDLHLNHSHCRMGHSWVTTFTPRDQLAELIGDTYQDDYGLPADGTFQDCADAALAAGWRPPARVIETPEALDALPFLSIVREIVGPAPVSGCDYGAVWERRTSGWECIAAGIRHNWVRFPARVLYVPDENGAPS